MASNPYFQTLRKVLASYYSTSGWQVMLLAGHTENPDTHEFAASVEANQIAAGGGYTTGGIALATNPTVVFDAAENLITVTFPELVIPNATISATHAIYKKELGSSGADELGFVNSFGGTFTSTNGNYTIPAASFTLDFPNT